MDSNLPFADEAVRFRGSLPPLFPSAKPLVNKKNLRDKDVHRESSFYVEEPKSNAKVMRWDDANNARPPLQIDMEGPTPWTYTPRNKPLNETNSPCWSFGSRCYPEKSGGSRTSWEKTWFQSKDIWKNKVDFHSDRVWPTPAHYEQKQLLGPHQSTAVEAPSFSIGQRRTMKLNKPGSDKEPAPNNYNRHSADSITLKKDPAFSLQFRRGGTCLWSYRESTPGPAAYSPRLSKSKPSGASFKIVGVRREKSHVLGPFATF